MSLAHLDIGPERVEHEIRSLIEERANDPTWWVGLFDDCTSGSERSHGVLGHMLYRAHQDKRSPLYDVAWLYIEDEIAAEIDRDSMRGPLCPGKVG